MAEGVIAALRARVSLRLFGAAILAASAVMAAYSPPVAAADQAQAPDGSGAVVESGPAGDEPVRAPEDWSAHGQYTLTWQVKPAFHSPYQDDVNSMTGKFQARATNTATLFLGARLWPGGEAYFDPEVSEGFGLSHTFGLAGYVNGEAQKGGSVNPKIYPARYFLKQVFGLGGEREWIEGGPNQLAGWQDVSRLTLVAGGVAASDFFQTNGYANDPRSNFTNWALWESGAWDVPGNARGYTRGLYAELNQPAWALRYGAFAIPSILNGTDVYFHSQQTLSHNLEAEERHTIGGHAGKVRVLGFYTLGPMGNYRDALNAAAKGANIDAAMQQTRTIGHEKFGVAASVEQELTDELGAFARLSWNNGRNEEWGFTDIDSSAAGGLSLKGGRWGRADDTVGVGAAMNGITEAHREFLAAGGHTLLLGDGALNYGHETDLEAFYSAHLIDGLSLTGDYQFINNPGYNKDRGPVQVFGVRVHAEF